MGKPPRALVFRQMAPDDWIVKEIAQHRIAAHVEAGWTVLLTEAELRSAKDEIIFRSEIDRRRPFNPPR